MISVSLYIIVRNAQYNKCKKVLNVHKERIQSIGVFVKMKDKNKEVLMNFVLRKYATFLGGFYVTGTCRIQTRSKAF